MVSKLVPGKSPGDATVKDTRNLKMVMQLSCRSGVEG